MPAGPGAGPGLPVRGHAACRAEPGRRRSDCDRGKSSFGRTRGAKREEPLTGPGAAQDGPEEPEAPPGRKQGVLRVSNIMMRSATGTGVELGGCSILLTTSSTNIDPSSGGAGQARWPRLAPRPSTPNVAAMECGAGSPGALQAKGNLSMAIGLPLSGEGGAGANSAAAYPSLAGATTGVEGEALPSSSKLQEGWAKSAGATPAEARPAAGAKGSRGAKACTSFGGGVRGIGPRRSGARHGEGATKGSPWPGAPPAALGGSGSLCSGRPDSVRAATAPAGSSVLARLLGDSSPSRRPLQVPAPLLGPRWLCGPPACKSLQVTAVHTKSKSA